MANIFHRLERPVSWSYLASHGGLYDEVLPRQLTQRLDVATRKPIIDISETDAAYMIRAEIPGIQLDDLNLIVEDNYLLIEASRKNDVATKEDTRIIRRESSFDKFSRSIKLGSNIDTKAITAECKNGILSINLPKIQDSQSRRIEILAA
tara:strand:- start:744 stop:1193 length:450 start_codon:yes stop_codon:yes gene_type:complete